MSHKPFWEHRWNKKDLPNGQYEITIPLGNVDIVASTGQLMIKTGLILKKDDILVICGIKNHVEIVNVIRYHPKHNLMVTVRCEEPKKLKELLTYAEIKILPKYKGGT